MILIFTFSFYLFLQEPLLPCHILHQHSIVQIGDRTRFKIFLDRIIPDHIPVSYQRSHSRTDMEFFTDYAENPLLFSEVPSSPSSLFLSLVVR